MALENRRDTIGDLIERLRRRDGREPASRSAHQAGRQPTIVMMLITEMAPLDAGVPGVHRIVDAAMHRNDAVGGDIDIDIDRTSSMTEPAERTPRFDGWRFDGHERSPS